MPRMRARDRDRAKAIEGLLGTVVDGAPPVLETLMPPLRDYLGSEKSLAYGVSLVADGCDVAFAHAVGMTPGRSVATTMTPWVRRSRGRFGLYDAARVDPQQRNRPTRIPPCLDVVERTQAGPFIDAPDLAVDVFRSIGVLDDHELRVLVTDGERLLAWVGGFQPAPFTGSQLARLRAITPALRRRLTLEARLETAALSAVALPAILERVPSPAFVVSAHGRIQLANTSGRARHDADPGAMGEAIRGALARGGSAALEVTPLVVASAPPCYLVVARQGVRAAGPRVAAAAGRHGLTPRETEVLLHLVQGGSNRAIALELGCAERTVEVHVAHLLDKVGVPSRSALIARFWMDG